MEISWLPFKITEQGMMCHVCEVVLNKWDSTLCIAAGSKSVLEKVCQSLRLHLLSDADTKAMSATSVPIWQVSQAANLETDSTN